MSAQVLNGPLPADAAFDFVIVGAGSAGCVLASRLSEDAGVSVCLLEAGPPDRHPFIGIPAAVAGLINHPVFDWRYRSVPQPNADGRAIGLPSGRALGGGSSINGMVYSRGHPSDYDGWAAQGNAGWSHAEVLPYFMRSEDNATWRDSPWHGTQGPMKVSDVAPVNPVVPMFIAAGRSLGLPHCPDFNAGASEGVGTRQTTIRDGRRESCVTAFLKPALGRRNLTVATGVLVDRVLLQDRRSTGVEYRAGGETRRLQARREVILCGGAFASPAILLRSGIGDAAQLCALGIEPRLDLPGVGANLQDHVATPTQFLTRSTLPYGASPRAWPRLALHVLDYLLRRKGLLASNVFEAAAFVRTRTALARPDIQLVFMPVHRDLTRKVPLVHGFGIQSVLLHPASRGSVTLASPDLLAPPRIDPNFFSAAQDLPVLLRGVRLAREILSAPAFASLAAREILPGPAARSDEELAAHIRATCVTTFHASGTCRMGNDPLAVVDAALCVRGITGLRVADASIMPTVTGGNTHAPCVMIGEKASDLVRGRAPPPRAVFPAAARQDHERHADPALQPLPL